MKKHISALLLALGIGTGCVAQSPFNAFNFQAVVRGADGQPLGPTNPGTLRAAITSAKTSTGALYEETFPLTPNRFGQINHQIGTGSNVTSEDFESLNWSAGEKWLRFTFTLTSNNQVVLKDTVRLLAVPFCIEAQNGVPPGSVMAFAGANIPTGWVKCDGAPHTRSDVDGPSGKSYEALFLAIGQAWGGSGTNGFNLPDFRGYFLRGVDEGSGNDPEAAGRTRKPGQNSGNFGDKVGSYQDDALQDHWHNGSSQDIRTYNPTSTGNRDLGYCDPAAGSSSGRSPNLVTVIGAGGARQNQETSVSLKLSTETRPKNAYVHYIIKL